MSLIPEVNLSYPRVDIDVRIQDYILCKSLLKIFSSLRLYLLPFFENNVYTVGYLFCTELPSEILESTFL